MSTHNSHKEDPKFEKPIFVWNPNRDTSTEDYFKHLHKYELKWDPIKKSWEAATDLP